MINHATGEELSSSPVGRNSVLRFSLQRAVGLLGRDHAVARTPLQSKKPKVENPHELEGAKIVSIRRAAQIDQLEARGHASILGRKLTILIILSPQCLGGSTTSSTIYGREPDGIS